MPATLEKGSLETIPAGKRLNTPAPGRKTRKNGRKALSLAGSLLATLAAGLRVKPDLFPAFAPAPTPPETFPLPAGLPAPVERYYRQTYGQQVPVLKTGILSGRGTMRLFGITFPMRCRFMHEAAGNFRACFELTFFGRPFMRVNEHFVNGKFRQELPFGVEEGEPKNDHSACVRMYAEWALWLPAMLLNKPGVRWEPIDPNTALLVVPWGAEPEYLVARFDPASGALTHIEAMKYKHPKDTAKTLWINAVWFGDRPWANFKIEERALNVALDTSLAVKGPVPRRA